MRWVIVFALVFGGCVASVPADPGMDADFAAEGARILIQLRQTPAPAPQGDKCDNCNGLGKVGDGRVFVPCPACDGTGKRKKSVVTHAPVVIGQKCPDGKCKK